MDLGKIIHENALECGYDNCGVISLEAFEKWMISKGIHYEGCETNMPGKNFPLRQAAVAAGLGIFRKNNFFYEPEGS